jgi:hypothetical protein
MPLRRDSTTRLANLETILAETTSGHTPAAAIGGNAADVHLNSVPAERIRRLTAELDDESREAPDAVDAIVMRLLLDEYTSAVAHLRAVARLAAARVDRAAAPLREARRAMHRLDKSAAAVPWLGKSRTGPSLTAPE